MVKVQRLSRKGVGLKGARSAQAGNFQHDIVCSPWRRGEAYRNRVRRNIRQNIPIRSSTGKEIRRAFIADPKRGTVLIGGDYSSLEMRLMTHFSQDEGMTIAINNGLDAHCATAADMYPDVEYDAIYAAKQRSDNEEDPEPDDKMLLNRRRGAKTIGFGLIYGQGPYALAESLGIDVREARLLIKRFFNARPGFEQFIKETHAAVKRDLYVRTLFGRKRRLYKIKSTNRAEAAQALRQAVNSIIQGSAAEIAKLAMIRCAQDQRLINMGCRLLLQVHDELIFELEDSDKLVAEAKPIIKHHMENVLEEPLAVPLTVDLHHGHSWVDVH
jgi:DNA polymerase I